MTCEFCKTDLLVDDFMLLEVYTMQLTKEEKIEIACYCIPGLLYTINVNYSVFTLGLFKPD